VVWAQGFLKAQYVTGHNLKVSFVQRFQLQIKADACNHFKAVKNSALILPRWLK
jgi:hypothetical protein